MRVRLAEERDLLGIVDGARDFVSRIDCPEFVPESDDELIEAVCRVLALPGFECVVAEHDGEVVGGVGMLYGPALWRPSVNAASEFFWWTSRGAPNSTALRLIRYVEKRMAHHGVRQREFMTMGTSPDGVSRVYRRMGLRKIQEMWAG